MIGIEYDTRDVQGVMVYVQGHPAHIKEAFLETWRISTESPMKIGWETVFQSMERTYAMVQREEIA